jgi:hypothetical protein
VTVAEIREHAAQLDGEIATAKTAIKRAQMIDAEARLTGKTSDRTEVARRELRRLTDLRDGSRLLAVQQELDEVSAEIAVRVPRLKAQEEKTSALKAKSDSAAARVARNDANDRARAAAYAPYEAANCERMRQATELRELESRRDRLEEELAEALGS